METIVHRASVSLAAVLISIGVSIQGTPGAAPQTARLDIEPSPVLIGAKLDPPPGSIVPPGNAPDVELLFTGDVIGNLDHCGCKTSPAGGLARRMWLKSEIQKTFPTTPIVLLDAGNFSPVNTDESAVKTRPLLQGMAAIGYRVANVGARDLELGYDDLKTKADGIPIELISANVVKAGTDEPAFSPTSVVEVTLPSGTTLKVGAIGVTRFDASWKKAGPDGADLATISPIDAAKKYVPELRDRADVVVLLASLPKDDAIKIAQDVPGIDFIFGAFGGAVSTAEETVGSTRIYYAGTQGQRVGEARAFLDARGQLDSVVAYMHHLTLKMPADQAMQSFVNDVATKLAEAKHKN